MKPPWSDVPFVTYSVAADLDASQQSLPRVSVIATWRADLTLLKQWFAALNGAGSAVQVQVVIVAAGARPPIIQQNHGSGIHSIRILQASPEQSPGEMRRAGMAAATGDIVVLTEDQEPGFEHRLASIIRGIEQRSGRTA
jgi:hypothetical protein